MQIQEPSLSCKLADASHDPRAAILFDNDFMFSILRHSSRTKAGCIQMSNMEVMIGKAEGNLEAMSQIQ